MTQNSVKKISLIENADTLLRRRGLRFVEETDEYIKYESDVGDGIVVFDIIFDKKIKNHYFETVKAPEGWHVVEIDYFSGDGQVAIAKKKLELGWPLNLNEKLLLDERERKANGELLVKHHVVSIPDDNPCDYKEIVLSEEQIKVLKEIEENDKFRSLQRRPENLFQRYATEQFFRSRKSFKRNK